MKVTIQNKTRRRMILSLMFRIKSPPSTIFIIMRGIRCVADQSTRYLFGMEIKRHSNVWLELPPKLQDFRDNEILNFRTSMHTLWNK